MSGKTPGQLAYEARRQAWETRVGLTQPDWDELHPEEHGDEEAGAQAVLNQAFPGLREQVRLAREDRDAVRALRAELEALVRIWREESEPYPAETAEEIARRGGFGYCADELAQVLARHPS